MPPAQIWTIGHSTRPLEDFLALLRANQISRLADIRTIPRSRRHPHFAGPALAASLASEGIEYRHFPELGGLRKPTRESPNGAWKNQSFRGYADHMSTPEFAAGLHELLSFGEGARASVMCAESVWWRCHRMLLSDAMVALGIDVRHIVGAAEPQPHRFTEFAKVDSRGQITYPALV